ncbi:hypothetical protein [Gaetbulibacter aestuarii]|uniref:Uncharacterized protein n=1 Tax=Gaetbulibacter aestuarii TaxID=1502358 RepID=A0ABW7MXX5_9FLAO
MEQKELNILNEISNLTRTIEEEYPELEKYLDESRSTLPKDNANPKVSIKELQNYRDSLQNMIAKYREKG